MALVVQNPDDQLLRPTVREDVRLGPHNLGLSAEEIANRTEASLNTLGLASLGARDVESLSFGEQKRACLAGALAMSPRLLLLDEPTAGLDPAGELEFCETLSELVENGTALIAATHAVDLVPASRSASWSSEKGASWPTALVATCSATRPSSPERIFAARGRSSYGPEPPLTWTQASRVR